MNKKLISAATILTLCLFVCLQASYAEGVGTGFTYQGRLIDANVAADGEYDLRFGLYDSSSDGNQTGGDIDINDVDLIDGYFTVELDFGVVFDGEARWLEIGVRAGDSIGAYSVLSPRQEITATPYSQKSLDGVPAGFMILGGTGDAPAGYSALGISMVAGGEDKWGAKTSMPTARKYAAAVVGSKVYVIGGEYDTSNRWLTVVEAYDPATDSWATKAPLPAGRRFHTAAAAGGKIYVFGGENSFWGTVSTTYEYDPVGDSWTTKASMPTGRKYSGAAVVDGKIYVIGGRDSSDTPVAANEMYDPAADIWSVKADMPTARQQLGVTTLGGKIYAIGGYDELDVNEEYDPVSDIWTVKADMPTSRYDLAAVSVVNRIYAIGGTVSFVNLNTNEMYDAESDAWSFKTNMLTSRSGFAAGVVEGKAYAIGGDTGGITVTNEEFSPRVELLVYIKD